MNALLIAILVLVVLLAAYLALQFTAGQKKSDALEGQVGELRRDLQAIATDQAKTSGQMATIAESVSQRLDGVTKVLQDGVANSAQIAAQAQSAMAAELKNSANTLGSIQKQLGEVQLAGNQMSQSAQALQNVLGGAKSRGLLGEVALERLLEDALPRDRFQRQFRFSSGEVADAVIFLRDKMLSIDSKFPLDSFRRMTEQGLAPAQVEESRRAFATAVKAHADVIAKKYILPSEDTLGIALMFVPSENVYYELLMTSDSKSQPLDEYCRGKCVVAVSPNTLYAHLQVILMGLQGMQIEENAKRLHSSLAGLRKQMDTFAETYEKLGTHLRHAQQSYGEAEKRFEKAQNSLGGMPGSGAPENATGDAEETPVLPPRTAGK